MLRVSRLLIAAALTLAIAGPASAAAVLAPLFTVPGLINTSSHATFFTCTNTDTAPVTVGIDVYGQAGNLLVTAASDAVSISPNATVMFGTAGALSLDVNLNPGLVSKGSAQIQTTSKKIVCSAFLIDPSTEITYTTLTMAAKGKQKGD